MQDQIDYLSDFAVYLRAEERSEGTIEKYLRDVRKFFCWLADKTLEKVQVCAWRTTLLADGYAPETVNSMIVALNQFLDFIGRSDCRVHTLRIQRKLFRRQERELTRAEYERMVQTAERKGQQRLALLLEAIAATGIRVSEVKYLTVEAARAGRAEIALKGKIRVILLPNKLCRKLLKYAKKQKTVSGEIFLTRNGKSLSRRQIWSEMKHLCKFAGVEASKVFPHNLRHL
ncbi:tyrosine-type recombinase/integrase, partial [Butyricicoccus pullicaecorum]